MTAGTQTFRVTLQRRRSVYRDIEIESANSLHDLAEAITNAFEFDFDHPFGFYSDPSPDRMFKTQPKYELFADTGDDTDARSVKKTRISDAFTKVGQSMTFVYDYGDMWMFDVQLTRSGTKAPTLRYPRLVGSKGTAPDQYPDPDED